MKVRDIMTWPVTALAPTDTLAFAEQLMNVERVRHFPVVDGDVLVGLISHRDILAASISTLNNPSEEEDLEVKRRVCVGDVMRGDIETVLPDDPAVVAADKMLTQKIGCVPVVDERHHLTGILTETDFVTLARELLAAGKLAPRTAPESTTRPIAGEEGARKGGKRAGR
jgi:CBS domain-containing membrane protein